ncbi:DUF6371 domain-containing protein [Xanthomarina sp. F1114]|uniref:DUF6371 domain-containing protein n=1 Tax=Xanthomarina sp. F1114 TaxID=2996019 RepID=UPI00225E1FF1|nr:DUF6371 domain-containing protein [Xanthomarina sp. F1114]MCX7546737.1 DUF6371 domain-containing protein [Xanthomarina sp. F1114]
MNYRYTLDPSSKKYRCKKCNKNTLVKFIDNETGETMNENFGRCDRQTKCGFFEIPKGNPAKEFEYKYEAPKPVSYHNYNLVSQSGRNYQNNNFIQFVKSLFGSEATKEIIKKYLIGTSKKWKGATVFWQIDNQQKVRHGKIMLYNPETGKRQKNDLGKAYISSVRSVLKLKDYNLKQCLFGLHLINETEDRSCAIVESEKTAVLMSLFKPEYVWLATGSKSGFKYEYLKPLRNYKIIGFPDKSEYNDWQNKAIELKSLGFSISISEYLETTNYEKGTDLADVLINEDLTYNKPVLKNQELKEIEFINTPTEKLVNKLILKNHNIKTLIDLFDLTDEDGNKIRV